VIYRLRRRNRRSRNDVVIVHMGRQCGTRVRPVSALMFSNQALQRTRPSRPGCNSRVLWAGSLSLSR
jgi:hypothetical protein